MTDYISREAAIEAMYKDAEAHPEHTFWVTQHEALRNIPAADVRPARRGKWKRVVDFTGVEAFGFKETMVVGWGCNVCGYEVDASEESFNFCPRCGADMRGEQDV